MKIEKYFDHYFLIIFFGLIESLVCVCMCAQGNSHDTLIRQSDADSVALGLTF